MAPLTRTSATTSPRGLGRDSSAAYSDKVTRSRLLAARCDLVERVGAIADAIDQVLLPRALRIERHRIDQLTQLGGLDVPLARHVAHELAVEAVEKLLQVLAGRAGVARLAEGVGRALVLVALAAFDLHAELVEAGP